jgi:hypothetical protein
MQDVIEVMKNSLFDLLEDELGNLDFRYARTLDSQDNTQDICRRTSGVSKAKQVKLFIAHLGKLAEREHNGEFTVPVSISVLCVLLTHCLCFASNSSK